MASDASHVLEAALEQVDDIIAGKIYTSITSIAFISLMLLGFFGGSLDAEVGVGHRNVLRRQLPTTTTHTLLLWLDKGLVNLRTLGNNESYQERLSRLEGDKESLVLQVSVLTDQVEAQGEKIRDLENSLEEHQHKLNSTEEMLQQELLSRTALETQKLDLMDEVSFLKLKLVGMEERQNHTVERQHNAEGLLQELRLLKNKVNELEDEKSQCEQKLKATKVQLQKYVIFQRPSGLTVQHMPASSSLQHTLYRNPPHFFIFLLYFNLAYSESLEQRRKTERLQDTSTSDSSPVLPRGESDQQSPVSQEAVKNNKSIRRLWGKIRRTQSGGLQGDDLEPTEFKRGGFRATAGPRLARTPESARATRDMTVPFSKWTTEQVCGWLEDCGLGHYVNLTRQWVVSGQTLLLATPQQFEKEMGIKHPLHRKKLQLALRSFTSKAMEKSSELDHIWVTRWLDDIGLPQYKDQFHESRVDGKMLQYLTVNDLLFLKVTSQLHHLSIKCAIHVLHVNKFNPHCLRRRPGDENKTSPSEVVQWSNHRVMEWLRSVDLAEYAPNLRGSGVHGGLIILEPRFSSETLAMLLNIPPQKTLLRRHLATNFNNLVGLQAQQEKREYANTSGHTPLTTTAKVRPKKLGFTNFSHLRKRRPDDSADYICPVEAEASPVLNGTPHHTQAGFRGLSPMTDRNSERVDHVGPRS
uniref:SAM domain-containing protein n=1 Tax=Electrophorus electricus TaxID=8005 RepID=A0A4W4GJK7_ELEEL